MSFIADLGLAFLFSAPILMSNAFPTVLGGGYPVDGYKNFVDGKRILGNHKTVRGLLVGILWGFYTGIIVWYVAGDKMVALYGDIGFALYDDVIPVMQRLREKSLKIGLITNLEIDMKPICSKLGLDPYLDFIVTSGEAGSDKPQPEIFIHALNKAGVEAFEAVHVGDQYKIDAVGAMNAGIKPIIIDRNNMYPDITDCPRIQTLDELFSLI